MLSRKPDDLPFISGTNRVGSSVERIVINILSAKHVQQLESAAHAATIVFYEFPSHQALLRQFWIGTHTGDIPGELLLRYQELRYLLHQSSAEEPDEAA